MFEERGENIAAAETMYTICNLRVRENTWYGGGETSWLSRLREADVGVASGSTSRDKTLGGFLTGFSVTTAFSRSLEAVIVQLYDKNMKI